MKVLIAILITTLTAQAVFARDWNRIEIPGAVCGDGLPYSVFIDKNVKSKNLLIEFMGGGVCWNFDTCYGLNIKTWMHPIVEAPLYSYLTSDIWLYSDHPFKNDSAIYLPYCTGDVFSADHKAAYAGLSAYHQGYRNVLLTLSYLKQKQIINFAQTERLTVWGASAGAIGALVHLKNIEPYFTKAKKIALIDSPGLHFGQNFWHKFTPELFRDFSKAFGQVGLKLDYNDGFIAQHMGPVLSSLNQWTIGILQSTRDQVMSNVFGDISPEQHKQLVLSDRGIAAVASAYSNTDVWIADTDVHTFLLFRHSSQIQSTQQESAIKFVENILKKPQIQF